VSSASPAEPAPSAPGHRRGFLATVTAPFRPRHTARERIGQVEDKVRTSVQAELDAVSQSLRAKAVQIRPSAIGFAVAAVLTVTAFGLIVVAGVHGLLLAGLDLWLAALIVAVVLLGAAAGAAAWARRHLPPNAGSLVVPMPMTTHPAPELVHPWSD
jgi:Flp pilus assembly protein TadB